MSNSKPTIFFPLPRTYGVAQLDIEATLSHLTLDAEALNAARKLRPLKCLVFLQNVRELPLPRKSEYKYTIYVVGAGLRPPNPERHITADMCVPILPNTNHPDTRRAGVATPTPEFPFQNCYHWFGQDVQLDVRVKKGEYMKPGGKGIYMLSGLQYVRMEHIHQEDNDRVGVAMGLLRPPSENPPPAPATLDAGPSEATVVSDEPEDTSDDGHSVSVEHDEEDDRDNFGLPPNLFGWDYHPTIDTVPIVDLWLDLPAHASDDDISDPIAFIQECNALSQIVKDLQQRQAVAEQAVAAAARTREEDSPDPSLARQLPYQALVKQNLFDSLKRMLGGTMGILRALRRRSGVRAESSYK